MIFARTSRPTGRTAVRRAALTGLFAVTAALALSACSSSASEPDSIEATDSPLNAMFASLSSLDDPEKQKAIDAKREDLLAECMSKEGFEYTPVANTSTGATEADVDAEYGSKEYAEKYGYGYFTGKDAAELSGETDPNEGYFNGLSQTEQDAYNLALYGPETDGTETSYDWSKAGCSGSAQHEADPTGDIYSDKRFTALFDKMNTVYEKAAKDPKVVEADAKWADCMADAGYTGFTTRSDAANSIYDAADKLYKSDGGTSVDPDPEAEKTLRKQDIDTAVADWNCADKVGWDKVQLKVQFALEQQFIDDNKADLDDLKAAMEKGSK